MPDALASGLPVVRVSRTVVPMDIAAGGRKGPTTLDYGRVITGPCVVTADARVAAVVVRYPHDTGALLSAVRSVPVRRVRRSGELVVATRVWGRFPVPRGSKETSLSDQSPSADAALREYAARLSAVFASVLPEHHARAVATARHPLAPGLPWTTGSINSATATTYHRDTKNAVDTWSGMLVLRSESVTGGCLVLPEYRVALDLRDGDALLFDGGATWHGNTPLTVSPGGYRYSLPCYAMRL